VHQNARISSLTARVVLDQVMCAAITPATTVSSVYLGAALLLGELHKVNYEHPILMQFDAVDVASGYTFSIITNVRLRASPTDVDIPVSERVLEIRNTTIKANTLRLDLAKTSAQESPIQNDVDFYSRHIDAKKLFPDSHFVSVDHRLELKVLRNFDSEEEKERVQQRLGTFAKDEKLHLLMTLLYTKADLSSLGFPSTGNHKQNRIDALARLLRLEPHSLRFFVPVAVGPDAPAVEGVGRNTSDAALNLYLDALHVGLGSGESNRHLQHSSEAFKAAAVFKMLRTITDGQGQLDAIQQKPLLQPNS